MRSETAFRKADFHCMAWTFRNVYGGISARPPFYVAFGASPAMPTEIDNWLDSHELFRQTPTCRTPNLKSAE
jgi:hypothetical protein